MERKRRPYSPPLLWFMRLLLLLPVSANNEDVSPHHLQLAPMIYSFLAGALTVGFLWLWHTFQLMEDGDLLDSDNLSWVDPWSIRSNFTAKVEDWTHRIGELPGKIPKRGHWPWETIRRSVMGMEILETPVEEVEDDESMSEAEGDFPPEQIESIPKEFCIGSIFGLDVGGTLAKLVYFEQKPLDYDPIASQRERHYTVAASAQAVLMARSNAESKPNGNSGSNLESPTPSGSSVPRRRSLSVGYMQHVKDLQKEQQQQQHNEEVNTPRSSIQRRKRHSSTVMHSESSQLDLRTLEDLRQDSVPDDLQHFRHSVADNALATEENESTTQKPQADMKRSRSMFDLSQSQKKAEALDRFYNFARRLDSYKESVKDHKLSFYSRELGGEFHFIRFETRKMQNAMDLIRVNHLHLNIAEMGATGGGAHKYAGEWERQLGIQMDKQEELDSLVAGMQFVLSTVVGECYTYRPKKMMDMGGAGLVRPMSSTPPAMGSDTTTSDDSQDTEAEKDAVVDAETESLKNQTSQVGSDGPPSPVSGVEGTSSASVHSSRSNPTDVDEWWWSRKVQRDAISYSSYYPYLVVTIGTGVSILRVDGPRQHERISGSSIGGGTYWGLIRLLTDVEDFEDVMRLAEKGDPAKVDMMVGDIYGDNADALEKLGLPSNIVASSFGKLVAKTDPAAGLLQEDLARALLLMVTNNIGQVAYLNAKLHKTSRIYFVGNFLRGNNISQQRLSYAIQYWSKGEMEALFLEHEGYFGALGAFLMSQNISHNEDGLVQPTLIESKSTNSLLYRRMKTCES